MRLGQHASAMTAYVLRACRFMDEGFIDIGQFQGDVCRSSVFPSPLFECRLNFRPPRPDERAGEHEKHAPEEYRRTDDPNHASARARSVAVRAA
jgi:hypothetical protein